VINFFPFGNGNAAVIQNSKFKILFFPFGNGNAAVIQNSKFKIISEKIIIVAD
jgi:tricorn protease-like protein